MVKPALFLSFHFLLTALVVQAQVLDLEYYTTRDGLVSHGIGDIYQDPLGRLWLGTTDGLSIYDGSEFKNYRTDNGLPLDFITCIAASRSSPEGAWIGTLGGGACKLVDERFSYISPGSQSGANHITALLEDRREDLWIGTVEGLYRVEKGAVQRVPLDGSENGIADLAEADDGSVWVGLSHMAALLKHDQPPLYINLNLERNDEVSCMFMDDHQEVWFGTSKGSLVRCNAEGVVGRFRISDREIRDIVADRNGTLWICSEDALLTLDKNPQAEISLGRFGAENGFLGEYFSCAFFDREENLWIGGLGTGLCKLRDRSLLKFHLSSLLLEQGYKPPVVVDSANHLWVADGEGLDELWRQSNSVWSRTRHLGASGKIICLKLGSNNTLWVGFLNREIHLYRFHPANEQPSGPLQLLRKLRPGIQLPSSWDYFILDSKGALWLAAHPAGVIVLEGDGFSKRTTFAPPEAVPHPDIRAMHEDRNGDIWIGGLFGGIVVYRRVGDGYALVRKLASGAGLESDEIRALYVDSLGRCWAGTRWGGITLTDGNTWRTLTISDGLLSMAVMSITEDTKGTVWIGTPLGLQGIDTRSYRLTKTIAGLVGESIASCGIGEDFIWAFTRKFLAVHDLTMAQQSTSPPLISIRAFRVNGTERTAARQLELSHDENNVAIDFAGISLKNEKGVRYRYRLLGAEEDWAPSTPYRAVTYAALEAGTYTFEVQAINSDGIESTLPASVAFDILPPLWQRWWFQVGSAMLIASLLWAAYQYRVAKLLEMERTRVRIAQDLHDEIGSTLSSISYFALAIRAGQHGTGTTNPDRLLSLIAESSSKAKGAMSDIIWAIDPSNDSWEDLLARMRRHASDVLESKEIKYKIDLPDKVAGSPPTMQQRRHIWLLFKELVANAAQHSQCTSVDIDMSVSHGVIELSVSDNGTGFDRDTVTKGTGLKSIHDRANALGATLQLETGPGRGTRWSIKWNQQR